MKAHLVRAWPRFEIHLEVDLVTARAELVTLTLVNISLGGAFLRTSTPEAAGSDVALLLQPSPRGLTTALALQARVIHTLPHGMGVEFSPPSPSGRALLEELVARLARDAEGAAREPRTQIGKVLALARTLFAAIERHEPFEAIGLTQEATEAEIEARLASLTRVFSVARADITPPQRARLESAQRALARVERQIAERVSAIRREAQLTVVSRTMAEVRALWDDAVAKERAGDAPAAYQLFVRALALAPDDDAATPIRVAITRITDTLDAARARELLSRAEVFVDGVGMRDDAVRLTREAARLSSLREIRLRALRVLAKAGETDDAIQLAQALTAVNPGDPLALQALFHLHERAGRDALALRAGKLLLQQRPDDVELRARLNRFEERVRKASRER